MSEQWYYAGRFFRRDTFRFGDCTADGNASIYAIMKLLSEMAGEDYERRGRGFEELLEHGQAFLLSRLAIKFHCMPAHTQTVTACTWERHKKGVFFNRDFEIRSEAGEILVSATSLWFIVNPETREVIRPAELYGGLDVGCANAADCPPCRRIAADDSLQTLGERHIQYTDLDANGHVNNAVYGRIAQDWLAQEYRSKHLNELYFEFKTETVLNDTLIINGASVEDGYAVQGVENGKLHFGSYFVFD
ncbi:MAG: hypothetical protein EOM14_03405 [Clostridia bacterium]|nr:hypothetical protein [Clostridia bacterium]